MSDSPLDALLSPKRRLHLQQLAVASTSPDPPLLSMIASGGTASTPLSSSVQRASASFGEEDKAALSCANSATTSPSQPAESRLSVSQRVKGLESSAKNPLIRPFQLGSPVGQNPAAPMGSPIERPYRRATFETQGKPLSSPSSAASNAAVEPLPSPLQFRRVSAPVPSPSHAAAVAAANAANDRMALGARRLTAPPVFSLPAAPVMTHAQTASPSQQHSQHPPSPVQLQAFQPRFHPYAEKALQSTVSLLSAAAVAPIGAADFLPAAHSVGLGGRAATAAQPCSSPSSSTQPAAAAAAGAKATAAAHFFSATSLVNLKPQHVPICCSRHGALLFLASIPPPPAYRGCEKTVVAPEKTNTIPKLPLWALAAAAAVHPSAEAVGAATNEDAAASGSGVHTRYPSGPSISAWIAEASAAAALNPLPMYRATSSSATPRSVPFPSNNGSGGSSEALQAPLQLSQWQQVQSQSQSQSQSPSPGPPALPRCSGLSVHVQGTPTPPTQQRNLGTGPSEMVPLGSPLSGISSCSSNGGGGGNGTLLSSSATPPPQHRLPASFHTQTAPFNFSGNAGAAGSLRVPTSGAVGGSNVSPTPRSGPHSAHSTASAGGAATSSPSYQGLQYPPVSPGNNLRPPPVLALGYTALPSSSNDAAAAAAAAATSATPPPPAAATGPTAAVSRIASLRTTFESSPSPLARQQQQQYQQAPMGSPNPASSPASSPPPPIPSFTPRARAVSAGYTQPQTPNAASITPRSASVLGPPLMPASPVPPPLPPFVPRDRPGSSGGGRSSNHASSAPSTPLSPSRGLSRSMAAAAERAPLLGSSPALTSSPEINSRTALLGAADSDRLSASASPSPPASSVSASASASGTASASASGLSMSPSPSPSPTPSPSVSPPLLPPIPASLRSAPPASAVAPAEAASTASAASASQAQLASLQQQLIDAVQMQHFEACIGLRDRIRAIEEELAREATEN